MRPSFTLHKHLLLRNRLAYKTKFYVEPPWVWGSKFCLQHLGHMTKMATTPIYGKNPSKIFSRTGWPISMKVGMLQRGLQPIIVCSNDDPGLTRTYFTTRSKFVTWAFPWEKVKIVDFSETIAASDLKVGRSRYLIGFMKVSIDGQGHYLTLAQGHVHTKIQT